MKRKMRKHTNKILGTIGMVAGSLASNIDALQGVLPNGWYVALFGLMIIADAWRQSGE
jgi:hypothetical protein